MIHLAADEAITVELPPGLTAHMLLIAYGPQSGALCITQEGQEPQTIVGYDAFSYYERLAWTGLERPISGRVTFEQMSALPEVALFKGEADTSPRVGKLGFILAS